MGHGHITILQLGDRMIAAAGMEMIRGGMPKIRRFVSMELNILSMQKDI